MESNLGEFQGRQEHILFVDDEDFVLEAGKDLLTDIGYRVTATSKAEKAIQLIERNPESFDLLITDQTMPNISGLELAKRVRSQDKSLPIVLCSGINDDIVRDELAKLGIAGFLPKPCSLYDMASAIREALTPETIRVGPSGERRFEQKQTKGNEEKEKRILTQSRKGAKGEESAELGEEHS